LLPGRTMIGPTSKPAGTQIGRRELGRTQTRTAPSARSGLPTGEKGIGTLTVPPPSASPARPNWRMRPWQSPKQVLRWATLPLSFLDSCHARQNVEHHGKIQLLPSHASRCCQEFIGDRGGRDRHVKFASQVHRKQHVFLHHVNVEPGHFRLLKNEGSPV